MRKRGLKSGKKQRQRGAIGFRGLFVNCFKCRASNEEEDDQQVEEQVKRKQSEIRKQQACNAFFQKLQKLHHDDMMRKRAYKSIQMKRRVVEANKAWNALPMKSEDEETDVSFNDAHLIDEWFYEEEDVPSQTCLKWLRILDEMRYQKEMEEEEEEEEEERIEGLLRWRGKDQLALLKQSEPASYPEASKILLFLMVGMAACVLFWFYSQRHRGLHQIYF